MEGMNERREVVVAITVTYNRTSTLKKCLDSLLQQTRCLDEIVIVDNNSRPSEQDILRQSIKGQDHIHLICLPENSGGAGGFEAGMRAVLETYQADWYWIMDDDAYPRLDCLEKLLEASNTVDNIGFLAPLIYGIDLQEYQLYHHKYLKGITFKNVPVANSYEHLSDINRVDANAFVGPLISKLAVESVGVADGSLFIYGDDTEYTYRITRQLAGYVIKSAVIEHQDPPLTDNYMEPKAWWKEYYSYRNQYFMIRKFTKGLAYRFMGYCALTIPILKLIVAALIKPKYKGYHVLRGRLLMTSIFDGLANHRGKTINPVEYIKLIAERYVRK